MSEKLFVRCSISEFSIFVNNRVTCKNCMHQMPLLTDIEYISIYISCDNRNIVKVFGFKCVDFGIINVAFNIRSISVLCTFV